MQGRVVCQELDYYRRSEADGAVTKVHEEDDSPSVGRQFSAGGGVGVRGLGGGEEEKGCCWPVRANQFPRASRQPLKPLQSEGADEEAREPFGWEHHSQTDSFGLNLLKVKSG